MRKSITRAQFTVKIHPSSANKSTPCVNILENNKFNFNGKLNGELKSRPFEICFTPDGKNFMMFESEDTAKAIKFPKSGSCKIPEATAHLRKNRIPFPANYSVWYNEKEQFWQGDYPETLHIHRIGKASNRTQ